MQTSAFSDALGGSRFTSETQNVFVYPYSGSYHRSNSKFLSGVLLEKKGDAECSEIQNEGKPKKCRVNLRHTRAGCVLAQLIVLGVEGVIVIGSWS